MAKSLGVRVFGVLAIVVLLLRCQSKFSEVSPEKRSIKGAPLTERLANKTEVDSRLLEVLKGAQKVELGLAMIRKIGSQQEGEDRYTPVDLLIDMSEGFSEKIADKRSDSLARHARLRLPHQKRGSKVCPFLDISLETYREESKNDNKANSQKGPSKEGMVYKARPCSSEEPELTLFEIEWNGSRLSWHLDYGHLIQVLQDLISDINLEGQGSCTFNSDENGHLETFSCKNIELMRKGDEAVIIRELSFERGSKGEVFRGIRDIYKKGEIVESNTCIFELGKLTCS